jgi:hypothetical protein
MCKFSIDFYVNIISRSQIVLQRNYFGIPQNIVLVSYLLILNICEKNLMSLWVKFI